MNLTNPALLLYREELPAEKTSRNYYLQIITHLQSYKEAFCDHTVWALLSKKLGCILQIVSINVLSTVTHFNLLHVFQLTRNLILPHSI